MASVRNILVGAAAVYVSKATTSNADNPAATFPTITSGASATTVTSSKGLGDTATWRDVGYTNNGLELSYEPDFGEVAVDQILDAARLFKQGQKVMLKTEFAEATLENLFIVMNQTSGYNTVNAKAGSDGSTAVGNVDNAIEIQGGSLGDYPVERSIVAVGQGPRSGSNANSERVYYASRAVSMETSSHGVKRNEATFFPVTFRLLPLASTSNAYGKIVDRSW